MILYIFQLFFLFFNSKFFYLDELYRLIDVVVVETHQSTADTQSANSSNANRVAAINADRVAAFYAAAMNAYGVPEKPPTAK